jgi:predicted phage-related endonuclease
VTSLPAGLSAQDIEERKHFIGGSDAPTIMDGDAQDVADRLAEKRGEKKPPNLNRVLPVRMGIQTEPLNIDWYVETTERPVTCLPIDGRPVRRHHPDDTFMACSLDGMTVTSHGYPAVLQAKHSFDYNKGRRRPNTINDLVDAYLAQVTHEMHVCQVEWAVLIALFGNNRWEYAEVKLDPVYRDALIKRERLFWHCRLTGERWPELPPPPRPDIADVLKISKPRDMSRNNEWVHDATRYRELKPFVEEFLQISDNLKALVDREVKFHFGAGVTATVSKTGSVTLKVDPDWNPIDDIAANDDDELTY